MKKPYKPRDPTVPRNRKEGPTRTVNLQLHVTPDEAETVKVMARRVGVPIGELLRRIVLPSVTEANAAAAEAGT